MKKPISRTASILPKILLKMYLLSKFRGYEEFILVEIAHKIYAEQLYDVY